jgi:TolB-like protein/DNA-binding winged helix-turn-helix (wHTH) protein
VPACVYEFGDFELDPSRFELRKNGRVLKLERIPMDLLILLAEKQGIVVTRQEIAQRLWGEDVFVDTEHGINTAIRKIRQALRDDPEQPRFVQTVTGKGYRFIAEKAEDRNITGRGPETGDLNKSLDRSEERVVVEETPGDSTEHVSPLRQGVFGSRPGMFMLVSLALLLCAVVVLALNPGGVRDRIFPANRASQIHAIAVLPLVNLSGDSSQEYFADGMTDELITGLAKNHSLRIVSRTSAMQYKGVQRPVRDIARELGVDGILEGSVSRSANGVHMTVQLIYAPTDTHVWAESYDRDFKQAFSLPEELSQTVAKEVKIATSPAPKQHYINPEAHDAYLRGLYLWFQFDTVHSLEYFEKAIHIQPDYAAAWAGMADAYAVRAVNGECPASEVAAKGEAAARKAVELDDSLAEAHHALAAWYFFFAWDLPRAEAESRRAVETDPNFSEAHHLHSYILAAMNRRSEALQEQKRATELDPYLRNWGLGYAYLQLRQFDDAINDLQFRAQVLPGDYGTHDMLSEAYGLKGMALQSQLEQEKAFQVAGRPDAAQQIHRAFERGGEKAVNQWLVDDLKARARKEYVAPFQYAGAYAVLRDKNETMRYLEESYRVRSPWLIMVTNEPAFDFLHADPRYHALIAKIGLPPAF